MKIRLLTTYSKSLDWVASACQCYCQRLKAYCQLQIDEIKPSKQSNSLNMHARKTAVTQQLLKHIKPGQTVLVCDESGKTLNSHQFAHHIANYQSLGESITLLMGGADGLDLSILDPTYSLWSLSSLTMPQHLARVMLLEQLYRSFTLINNHPYHRN